MRHLLIVLSLCSSGAAFAETTLAHARLVDKYEEDVTWANRSNFFFGARGGIAIPAGAVGLAPSAGIEMGIAPDFGFGLGVNVIWMNQPPGAPVFGIQPASWGFGATAAFKYYFPTIGPLTLFPSMSIGFLAGPDLQGRNQVLPLLNPGFGAKLRMGAIYASFEFGLSGFTIPFVSVALGYEGDRRHDRAEAWALKQEEEAAEKAEELQRQQSLPAPTVPPPPPAS